MPKPNSNNQSKLFREGKDGYLIIPNYFLREWVKVLGIGPALLYLQLLSYCHKEKDIAWPTLTTLSSKLGISKNSLLSYRKILLKSGLIKKIVKRRTAQGNYQSNFYKVTPIEGAKIEPRQVQILGEGSANIAPGVVQNLHPNNNNLNNNNITTTNRGKDAVVAVVDFKKLKEKGEEKMQTPHNSKEYYKEQAIREQLMDLDFGGKFIEQLLKDYPPKKIEEKLDLLLTKKNIQNPVGWLMSALKNDYQDPDQNKIPSPLEGEGLPCVVKEITAQGKGEGEGRGLIHQTRLESNNKKILSHEEAARRFHLLRDKLKAMN
ncbi:helix-turn-helix domain-containing protein [bacterium]|nr:helix-turn-helix domain-containing protein [bacterium]MBU2440208.1 helix-turn-helix domain-containing protein [bacterium]